MKLNILAIRSPLARVFLALCAVAMLVPGSTSAAAEATPQDLLALNGSASAAIPSSWYRYQGAVDSGACAGSNCGPAAVAMAIGYAKGRWIPISTIRAYIAGKDCRGTDYNDMTRALTNWKVKYKVVGGMAALAVATNTRKHPVMAMVNTGFISDGKDSGVARSSPANHYGRYHGWTSGHVVVVTGVTADKKWVIVQDPYVFSPQLGFYSNGAPKGRDRYYSYDEFARAYAWFGSEGLEITPG